MNREEFLRQLEGLLSDISEEERADALAFYRSYFEDAGEGNEAAILAELQSPQRVADSIKRDLGFGGTSDTGTANTGYTNTGYTNTGYTNTNGYQAGSANSAYGARNYQSTNTGYGTGGYAQNQEKKKTSGSTVTAWVIVAILTSPIWLTIVMGILSVLLGIVGALLGVAVAVLAIMVALLVAGFVLIGCGISAMATGNPPAGIGLLGGGFLVLALGILAVILAVWLFFGFVPWAVRGIAGFCRNLFTKRKEREAA